MTRIFTPMAGSIARPPLSRLRRAGLLLGVLAVGAGHANEVAVPHSFVVAAASSGSASHHSKDLRMWMNVGNRRFAVTLADTDAAREFAARLPLTLDMTDLNGNEKKFDLPKALPANASRPGKIHNGDLMLYGASTLVVFYLTFDSPYSYTRIGRVDEPDGLARALGQGTARIDFARE